MSTLLTEAQWAERMRSEDEAVDKSYRRYPIGQIVGHFMRAIRYEEKSANTLVSYEPVLRLFTLYFRDFESLERFAGVGGLDLIYKFLDHYWGDSSRATKRQRGAILRSFFSWAEDAGHISRDPTRRLRTPKPKPSLRVAHEIEEVRLIAAAGSEREEAAVLLMGRLAFRKSDVRLLRVRDVDLAHDCIYIREGKGDKPAQVPIEYEDVRNALKLWLAAAQDPREFLLHPRHDRFKPLEASTMQRWWRRLLERADVSPFPMHELRHSALDRLWRSSGNVELVRQLARHESIRTTQDYLHASDADLRAAMRASEVKD